jgi:hypothetical protein
MGLLKSIKNVPGIDFYEFRDQDYYNKYTYRARLTFIGTRQLMYAKDEAELVKRVNSTNPIYGSFKEERPQMKKNLPILVKILEWKIKSQKDKKSTIRLESNTLAVFSNDLSYLKTLEAIDPSLEVNYTEVQKSEFVGVKNFVREPKHKYRVYLKSKKIERVFISDLQDLLDRTKGLYPSPGLKCWLSSYNITQPAWGWRYRWTSASHFIDYDDESTLSYLALLHGEMLGKRYKLEKRPEEV